jgi:hypothetical protein
MKPLATYNLDGNTVSYEGLKSVVWAGLLDKRYKLEVIQTEPYSGTLFMFDGNANDELIHHEDVKISYDAKYGPDALDVSAWQDIGIKIADSF